jgi:hypothetical protein
MSKKLPTNHRELWSEEQYDQLFNLVSDNDDAADKATDFLRKHKVKVYPDATTTEICSAIEEVMHPDEFNGVFGITAPTEAPVAAPAQDFDATATMTGLADKYFHGAYAIEYAVDALTPQQRYAVRIALDAYTATDMDDAASVAAVKYVLDHPEEFERTDDLPTMSPLHALQAEGRVLRNPNITGDNIKIITNYVPDGYPNSLPNGWTDGEIGKFHAELQDDQSVYEVAANILADRRSEFPEDKAFITKWDVALGLATLFQPVELAQIIEVSGNSDN